VGDERGSDHADADGEHTRAHVELGLLLAEDGGLDRRRAATAVLLGPRDARPSTVVERALPRLGRPHVGLLVGPAPRAAPRRLVGDALGVLVEPCPGLGAEGGFLG